MSYCVSCTSLRVRLAICDVCSATGEVTGYVLHHLHFVVLFLSFRDQLETTTYTKTANEQEDIKFVTTFHS